MVGGDKNDDLHDIESYGAYDLDGSFIDPESDQATARKVKMRTTNKKEREKGSQPIWQHHGSIEQILRRLGTDADHGLSLVDVEKRLLKFGHNRLTPPPRTPRWRQFLRHFTDFFSLMLQFAAMLCFLAFITEPDEPMHLSLGIVLYVVVISTSLFSYLQQCKSDRTLREFRNFLPPTAIVRRDGGCTFEIDAADLVVGDIVQVKLGDKIPADLRILSSNRFTVDNSVLTGESEPVELGTRKTSENPLETDNLAFFGCLAVEGTCTGVVITTGDRTVFGEIARLTSSAKAGEEGKTTLQNDIHHFVVNISAFAISVGVLFFVVGMVKGVNLVRNLAYSIGIIVSNIPEGLLATVTVSLTASAKRMAKKNVLVKRLDAVEALGSTTAICSDKTGTLTQNRMNVSHIAHGGRVEAVHTGWVPPQLGDEIVDDDTRQARECQLALIYGATVCSTAAFDETDSLKHPQKSISERVICGDASEAGILRFTEAIHNVKRFREHHPLVASIPFNSRNKYMVTVHRCPDSVHLLRAVVKGAPERILERCTKILSKEGCRLVTKKDVSLIEEQIMYLASRGERVLAYAERYLNPQETARILNRDESNLSVDDVPTTDLCFVGLISLTDPPRESVSQAVQTCKNAGIRVIMITGDHVETARSVAQQVGIITKAVAGEDESSVEGSSTSAIVVKGQELKDADEDKWNQILSYEEIVFARTSPRQKLEIVQHLQRLGEIVTVTGDGCNDAPALKQANTGVAMGISGSQVSREAANIILLDDNFSSIVNGVEEGRLIFDNLKKSIAYTLTSNVPQLVPFLVFIVIQIPLPLTTVLVLCIDLGTDIFPAIALAYEQAERDIMNRPPRDAKTDHLMSNRLILFSTLQLGVIQSLSGFFAYLVIMSDYGLAMNTLPNLNARGFFGSERAVNQRWMYTIQEHHRGIGFEAAWFTRSNPMFAKYFATNIDGFVQQTEERFDLLPAKPQSPTHNSTDGTTSNHLQFQNMVKIIGHEVKRPPCLAFKCKLDGGGGATSINDYSCLDPKFNSNPIDLINVTKGTKNDQISPGRGSGQGCFDFWNPLRQQETIRRAQTGFFVSIVIAQIFTLCACKTRILSIRECGIKNSALIFSVLLELIVCFVLVYFPLLRPGFDVRPLKAMHWLPGIPLGVFILLYDECRKWFIRRHLVNESGLIIPGTSIIDRLAAWLYDLTFW